MPTPARPRSCSPVLARARALSLAAAALAGASLHAQTVAPLPTPPAPPAHAEPISTDRPDFTESASAVPDGRVQLEAGYTYTQRDGDLAEHAAGEVLLRLGLGPGFELRAQLPSFVYAAGEDDEAGLSDAGLGFKLELCGQEGPRPALAVIAGLSLPTGSDPFSADSVIPEATLAWSYDLDERFSVGGNFNLAIPEDEEGDRFAEPSASVALGIGLTERLGSYVEYFGFYPGISGDGADTHYADAGLTYLITPDLQLDARIGAGLNDEADDLFAGAGVAVRW